jgi:diaminohydroxyphosphoribosylaminopyrimidine deaminase / 5-amino-6-(5-phosphoribosylamino)uracil reductase
MNEHDIRFMQRALELARKGVGLASPNPTVGCVIVNNGHVVGEGFHQYDWRDHAEVVALKTAGEKARGATAYVTLEPCNHTGRTGPCTEALIRAGIARVVVAFSDPNPKVEGGGIERLNAAGIATEFAEADLTSEAEELNESFFRWVSSGKPFVTLKSALTLDGQLALPKSPKKKNREWITSEESRAEVHRIRHASDALLTGIGTILADNPLLTDRSGLPRRRRLLRVVLDSHLRLPPKSKIVASHDDDLLVFTSSSLKSPKACRLQNLGIELLRAPARRGLFDLNFVLKELGRREILSVLLESGPTLNAAALAAKAVDKLVLFYAPKLAGRATVPFVRGSVVPPQLRSHRLREQEFGPDFCLEAWLRDPV